MNQYTPVRKFVEFKELNRKLQKESMKSSDVAVIWGFRMDYPEGRETVSESFIPDFDYRGEWKNTP